MIVTKEERDLNARIDRGEFESILTPKQAKAYAEIARNTFAKQRTVNVRISERNLLRLKAAAAREGGVVPDAHNFAYSKARVNEMCP